MDYKDLELIVKEYEEECNKALHELNKYNSCDCIKIILDTGIYCIISPCAKIKNKYQCTYFDDIRPMSDTIRDSKEELYKEIVQWYKIKKIIPYEGDVINV